MSSKKFLCQFESCLFQTCSFKRLLQHTWDKHSLSYNSKYTCNISGCPKAYTNHQSYRRHVKASHNWFYEIHFKGNSRSCGEADLTENIDDSENHDQNNELSFEDEGQEVHGNIALDADEIISDFLLELREKFNVTTDCTCFVSQKVIDILCLDRKMFVSIIKKSLTENENFVMDYETDTILSSKSIFHNSCCRFTGKKALTGYITDKPHYIKPNEIPIGFNADRHKSDTLQYVPILETLCNVLEHEDVLGTVLQSKKSDDTRIRYLVTVRCAKIVYCSLFYIMTTLMLLIRLAIKLQNIRFQHFIL